MGSVVRQAVCTALWKASLYSWSPTSLWVVGSHLVVRHGASSLPPLVVQLPEKAYLPEPGDAAALEFLMMAHDEEDLRGPVDVQHQLLNPGQSDFEANWHLCANVAKM